VVKRAADRFRRAVKRIADWCRRYRHEPVREQWTALKWKLLGHFGYFGITGNFRALCNLRHHVIAVWRKWLSRRSQRARIIVEGHACEAIRCHSRAFVPSPSRSEAVGRMSWMREIRTSGSGPPVRTETATLLRPAGY
jgi:hypothetical protein